MNSDADKANTRVFVSYAREDGRWLERDPRYNLIPFLEKSLKRLNAVFWYDKGLIAGDEFRKRIEAEIDRAQIALLIVSQHFLNSQFIETVEMPRIVNRAKLDQLVIIPVLVEPSDWQDYEFLADRQMIPASRPLIEYTESEIRWSNVRKEILDNVKAQVKRILEAQRHLPAPDSLIAGKKYFENAKYDDALPHLRKAAEAGCVDAAYHLGLMYKLGVGGLRENFVEAANWFRKGALGGVGKAMSNLARMYQLGQGGLPKDLAQAVSWYRKAADAGDAESMHYLGGKLFNSFNDLG